MAGGCGSHSTRACEAAENIAEASGATGEARSAKTRVFSFQGPSPARYILPVSPNPLDTTKKTRRRPDGNPSPAARATTDNAEPGSGGRATPSDQRWQLLFSGAAIIGQKEEALVLWPRTHLVELSELAELVPQVALLARAAEVSDPHLRSGYVSHDLYVLIRCCSRFSFPDKKGECLVFLLESKIGQLARGTARVWVPMAYSCTSRSPRGLVLCGEISVFLRLGNDPQARTPQGFAHIIEGRFFATRWLGRESWCRKRDRSFRC